MYALFSLNGPSREKVNKCQSWVPVNWAGIKPWNSRTTLVDVDIRREAGDHHDCEIIMMLLGHSQSFRRQPGCCKIPQCPRYSTSKRYDVMRVDQNKRGTYELHRQCVLGAGHLYPIGWNKDIKQMDWDSIDVLHYPMISLMTTTVFW